MSFGEKVKKVCELEGINLKEFSELCGFSYSTMKSYSQGRSEPTLPKIQQITEVPRFSKYKELLLSLDESAIENYLDSEIISLHQQLQAEGKGEQALEYLKFLAGRAGK